MYDTCVLSPHDIVVQELGLPYVNISGNAIYGSNRGDGERMIRSLFVQAASSAKKAEPHQGDNEPTSSSCAILIIDDLEAIGKVSYDLPQRLDVW